MTELPITRYEIREECGRGRFATVYHAWDKELQRDVALKVSTTSGRSQSELSRIRRESRISCRLRHPNIVSGFDAIQFDSQECLCLPLLKGGTLQRKCVEVNRPIRVDIDRLALVGDAVHYLHSRGLIHGDIKPENILLDESGRPYLTDFGSCQHAKQPDDDIVGTPAYLAPELARGEAAVSVASDVYALGATLYEMLCGTPAFVGDAHAVLEQIRSQPFPIPSSINRRINRSLDRIIGKACSAKATDRYSTAAEFSQDLRNYLASRPLLAKRTGAITAWTLWCRRNPTLAALATTLALVFLLGTGFSIVGWRRSMANQQALIQSEERLRAQGEIAANREKELATLLASIQHEQTVIELASDNEKGLVEKAALARVEIDAKSLVAQEQIAEAKRLNDLIFEMKDNRVELRSNVDLASRAVSNQKAFADIRVQLADRYARLEAALRQMPSVRREFAQDKWNEIMALHQPSQGLQHSMGWRHVNALVNQSATSKEQRELPRDVTRIVADQSFGQLLFLRTTTSADLWLSDPDEPTQSISIDLRRIAGLPSVESKPELAAFSLDGTKLVTSHLRSPSEHELIVCDSLTEGGKRVARFLISFDGVIHSIRFLDDRHLYLLRSIRTSGDLELYNVLEEKVLWSCRATRVSEDEKAALFPFFIQCGTNPWESLVFASSPLPTEDGSTDVYLHSVDLRTEPLVTTFACGKQTIADWPHQWQLSESCFLGIGTRSLATMDPPSIDHRRFDISTTRTDSTIQAMTSRWSPISADPTKQYPSEYVETSLSLQNVPWDDNSGKHYDPLPYFSHVAGELIYWKANGVNIYNVFANVAVGSRFPLSQRSVQHMVVSPDGTSIIAIGRNNAWFSRFAEWDPSFYTSVDDLNVRLAEVAMRFESGSDETKLLALMSDSAVATPSEVTANLPPVVDANLSKAGFGGPIPPEKVGYQRFTIATVDHVDWHRIRISKTGIESTANRYAWPTFDVNGLPWKPETEKWLMVSGERFVPLPDLNYSAAEIWVPLMNNYMQMQYSVQGSSVDLLLHHPPAGNQAAQVVVDIPNSTLVADDMTEKVSWTSQWNAKVYTFGDAPPGVTNWPNTTLITKQAPVDEASIPKLDFVWHTTIDLDPSRKREGLPSDRAIITAERTFICEDGLYRVESFCDDGIRVWVDEIPVITDWRAQHTKQNIVDLELSAGSHQVRLEYLEYRSIGRLFVDLRRLR